MRAITVDRVAGVWDRYRWENWAEAPFSGNSYITIGTRLLVAGAPDETESFCLVYEAACGFPAKSIAYGYTLDHGRGTYRFHDCVRTPWQARTVMFGRTGNYLPYRVLLLGFAINTIFYGAILWSLTLGPITARRMIRRKRGRCIKCAYDLRGTSGGDSEGGCPECGWGREDAP
ncbi:MAG: hypothetical protein IIC46_04515 [Planctomycetes bacterium]|nr:hypothetical protein [Planctomycetota bacterium]